MRMAPYSNTINSCKQHIQLIPVIPYMHTYIQLLIQTTLPPVSVRRFPSFRTQPLENLSHYLCTKGFLSNPAPGDNLLSGNLVMETGCMCAWRRPASARRPRTSGAGRRGRLIARIKMVILIINLSLSLHIYIYIYIYMYAYRYITIVIFVCMIIVLGAPLSSASCCRRLRMSCVAKTSPIITIITIYNNVCMHLSLSIHIYIYIHTRFIYFIIFGFDYLNQLDIWFIYLQHGWL